MFNNEGHQVFDDKKVFAPLTPSLGIPQAPVSLALLKRAYSLGLLLSYTLLVTGHLPENVSLLQVLWGINNGDISPITKDILAEHCPQLLDILERLREAGPQGDLRPFNEHFITHLNVPASTQRPWAGT